MDQNREENNVTPLYPHYTLINPELRTQIKKKVEPIVEDKADDAIDALESALCTYIVGWARKFFTHLGKKVGHKLTTEVDKVI